MLTLGITIWAAALICMAPVVGFNLVWAIRDRDIPYALAFAVLGIFWALFVVLGSVVVADIL